MITKTMMTIGDRYWLLEAHVPQSLIIEKIKSDRDGLCAVDLEIQAGIVRQIVAAGDSNPEAEKIYLGGGIVLPCFVDIHTHLDKGHIWERTPNPDGTFDTALRVAQADRNKFAYTEDVYRRMEFGIKCSYVHGTKALRTHIDAEGEQADISLEVFRQLQQQWSSRLIMQAVSLVSLDYYLGDRGEALADKIADIGAILGGVAYTNPDLDAQLDTVFKLAAERGLDLDFHADENGEVDSICLQKIAAAAIKHRFEGKITCGHCCSLAVQPPEVVGRTLDLVKQANISIVSLPMCNLFLQGRKKGTPFWRGIPLVHELKQHGIPVAFASDNCRDPFHAFGDHDGLEVFKEAVKIAHLDTPYQDWINSVTQTPAAMMGLTDVGKIRVGLPADLILFRGRYWSELLARSQHDRTVLHHGKPVDLALPLYQELDDLVLGND